jgi:hypothetical protein
MIERAGRTIVLAGACTVEDAETLFNQALEGADAIDISGCTFLHTACLQVLLVARLQLIGTPADPALARWIAPFLQAPILQARFQTEI